MENTTKICTKCHIRKELSYFYKDKGTKSGLGSRCKDCVKACAKQSQEDNRDHRKQYLKNYKENNREKLLNSRRNYRECNRESFREYHRYYHKDRRKKDTLYRIKHNIRNRLWSAFQNTDWKTEGSIKLLGADYETVKSHIESLFIDNMSWGNYGRCLDGDCANYWHIDHIIPLNTASTKEELEKLCHYKNLQPLWAIDNLSKPKL